MKRKVLKGFTLVELIVTMAIMTVLMAAIMQMLKPVRETFVESTMLENRRSAQSGVITYITESLRYATDIGIYQISGMNADNAITTFAGDYAVAAGLTSGTTEYSNAVKLIKENAQIIVIDHKGGYKYGEAGGTAGDGVFHGRLLRRIADSIGPGHGSDLNESAHPENYRIAMGAAYYGASDYSITITADVASSSIGVSVASAANYGALRKTSTVTSNGLVVCQNLKPDKSKTSINGFYDVHIGGAGINSGTTLAGENTYIIFMDERPAGLPTPA